MAFNRLLAPAGRKTRSLDHLPLTCRYEVRIAGDNELPDLASLAERHIPGIINACETARLLNLHHRGSVFTVLRGERIVGAAAFLYLNSAGLAQLQSGIFPYGTPELDHLDSVLGSRPRLSMLGFFAFQRSRSEPSVTSCAGFSAPLIGQQTFLPVQERQAECASGETLVLSRPVRQAYGYTGVILTRFWTISAWRHSGESTQRR